MPAATAAKAKATASEAKPLTSVFLSEDQIEGVGKDTSANDSYVGLSKLDEGKAFRYRFLGSAITGYSTWLEVDGKSRPIRWRVKPEGDEIPGNIQINKNSGKPTEIKRFVAGFVWDYAKERVSVLNIDQKTILQDLHEAIVDPDYGDPQEYDIKITRTMKDGFIKYTLKTSPLRGIIQEIQDTFDELIEKGADLSALFDNGNPFEPETYKASEDDED